MIGNKRVAVTVVHGDIGVDIRKMWRKPDEKGDDDWKPSNQGVWLPRDAWRKMLENQAKIDQVLADENRP